MKKEQVNRNKINEVEIISFLKEWLRNTNEEIEIDDIKIKQKPNMMRFYREFLESFLKNKRRHRIFGVDKMMGFEINIANDEEFLKVCQDIWDNPQDYYKLKEEENEYYEFIKFLWVDSDTYGRDTRLVDLVNTDITA
jgi:hypothetical protein